MSCSVFGGWCLWPVLCQKTKYELNTEEFSSVTSLLMIGISTLPCGWPKVLLTMSMHKHKHKHVRLCKNPEQGFYFLFKKSLNLQVHLKHFWECPCHSVPLQYQQQLSVFCLPWSWCPIEQGSRFSTFYDVKMDCHKAIWYILWKEFGTYCLLDVSSYLKLNFFCVYTLPSSNPTGIIHKYPVLLMENMTGCIWQGFFI